MDTWTPEPPAPVEPQPQPEPPRRGWRWRSTVAGAVAGGVLAASVAVPVTWALARDDQPADSSSTTATADAGFTPPDLGSRPDIQDAPDLQPDTQPETQTDEADEADATDDQSQGVVLIDTTLTNGEAAGTGLVLDASGLVLTNYHVVEGSTSVTVTVATDGTTYDAEVVGFDEAADVALLQLQDASGLTTVDLDDDGDPAVADEVTAVGNAEGQGYLSASTGTVVALEQSITTESTTAASGEDLAGLIETDAYVVGGYSGGALLDDEGEVVGITTAASGGGPTESYAVPIEDALAVAEQIESGDETGGVQVGPAAYLGVGITETGTGLQVGQVEAGSPADDAGVEAGATLTRLGGRALTSYDVLRAALAGYQPGDRVALRWTDAAGVAQRATITLAESPIS